MVKRHNKAQSLIEYGFILSIVAFALLSMQVYFKRGVQSVVKVVADDFGAQGEHVNDIEFATKKKVYSESYLQGGSLKSKLSVNAKGTNSSVKKISLSGEGSARIENSSSNTALGDEPSFSISGDYRNKKIK